MLRIHHIKGLLQRSLDPFVHGSVAADEGLAALHRGFLAAHFAAGVTALGLVPLAISLAGPAPFAAVALALVGLEALTALYVSRTGRLAGGQVLSALLLTLAVATVAAFTGGLSSIALIWFAVAPIEASLSGDRRVIAAAAGLGGGGLAAVAAATLLGLIPEPAAAGPVLGALAGLAALAYAATVAFRVEAMHRGDARRLKDGEARYRLLADTMTDMVTCHGPDGDVTFASPAAERLVDASPRQVAGDGLFRRVHVADRPAYLTALSQALHQGAASAEFRLRRGDLDETESWVWVEMRLSRGAPAGANATVVGVTRDIGRHKAQEAELEKARQDAEMASFAKTRFLANMSHELRTPLNAIIGFSDMLGQEMFGKFEYDRQREYSRLIKESGEHLLQVVNDILDMAKIEAGSFDVIPEPFDVAPVIERCRQILLPQAVQAGVDLVSTVEPHLPELNADRRACRQILLNLLSNAVKFTDRGGRVEVGARREGRRLALTVRDTGIGIAAEDLKRIGLPFVQADCGYDRRAEGTGLGLSVVKGLVALHGGKLEIESTPGVGTTVTVLLPLAGAAEPTPLAPRAERRADPAGPRRALRA